MSNKSFEYIFLFFRILPHKTAEEMADKYSFGSDQRKILAELLVDENNSMWGNFGDACVFLFGKFLSNDVNSLVIDYDISCLKRKN